MGSFIFLGPTGVGKTELARSLAEFLFDDEQNMIRIDMSEYMEKHAVSRLIGAPPGYVGFEEGGQLTEAVRRKPYSVILFDEIEKAHYDVFNLLLQILEDGRLTDSHGRTVDFKNTIIIMTSNLGSEKLMQNSGVPSPLEDERTSEPGPVELAKQKEIVLQELKRHLRPEFINRVDDLVVFHPLGPNHLKDIIQIQLERLKARLSERQIELEVDDPVVQFLSDAGYDPVYGARPLKRAIQKELETELGRALLGGKVRERTRVRAVMEGGRIQFN